MRSSNLTDGGTRRKLLLGSLEGACALVAYAVVSSVVTWPLVAHLGTAVIGNPAGDMGGGVGWLWTLRHEGGFQIFGATQHTLTGAPLGWEQGNAINLQWLLPYYPAYLVSLAAGEVMAFNLTVLGGLTLSATAMYALARALGCDRLVAGWAGLVFMLLPWLIWRVNVGHASLTHLEVFPLLFLALHEWARQPTWRRAALVGVLTAAAWLTFGYFGAMAVIGALTFATAAGAVLARAQGVAYATGRALVLAAGVLGGTIAIALVSLPGRVAGGITVQRVEGELSVFGARPGEYLLPAVDNPLLGFLGSRFRDDHGSNPAETTLFLGWLTVILAIIWLGRTLLSRRALSTTAAATTAGLATACLAALAFSAPSPIGVGGGKLFTWTPSWWLFQVLPEIRVPSRFVVLVAASLVPLAALGLQVVSERVRAYARTPRTARSLASATATVAVAASIVELFPSVSAPVEADRPPLIYEAIERTPDGILAEYSLIEASDYRFWQRLHGRPLLNGAREGTAADDLRRGLVDPGAPGTAETLALLGVTAIATRADALDYTDDVPDVPNADWGPGYALVARFPDGSSVWQVVARPAPAVAILRGPGFGEPQRPRGDFIGRPLTARTGEIELRARTAASIRVSFVASSASASAEVLRVTGSSGEVSARLRRRTSVSFVVAVPRGVSRVTVSTRARVPVELSAPNLATTDQRPALIADPISEEPGF